MFTTNVSSNIFCCTFHTKDEKNLQDFRDRDYILCTGDPAVIGLSSAIVSDITQGKFNLLKWDRQETKYYPLTIDLYQKGEINE